MAAEGLAGATAVATPGAAVTGVDFVVRGAAREAVADGEGEVLGVSGDCCASAGPRPIMSQMRMRASR